MKKLSILLLLVSISFATKAQTEEELKKQLGSKKSEIAKLDKEAKAIKAKLDALPGWRKGAFGTIGGNLSGYTNWFSREVQNVNGGNINVIVNGFANLIEEKFFWRNSGTINLGWVKLDDRDDATDSSDFNFATDVFNISSLYGRRLSKKWAVSALAEYRTTIEQFNNPGYLDFGAGFTWTPTSNLVVVMHPGNYNFVFSKGDSTVFESSLGAKIVADYNKSYGKLSVKSNLSIFQSYESSDLSNWTFTNSFGYTVWKGIGVGLEVGLRKNRQEAANVQNVSLEDADNKLQSYYVLGLSYAF